MLHTTKRAKVTQRTDHHLANYSDNIDYIDIITY